MHQNEILYATLITILIFFLEVDARHDADCGDAEEENSKRRRVDGAHLPQLKKQITDQHIKQSPYHIYGRRRESLAGRFGKR